MAAIHAGAQAFPKKAPVSAAAPAEARLPEPSEFFEEEAFYPIEDFYEPDPDDEEVILPG